LAARIPIGERRLPAGISQQLAGVSSWIKERRSNGFFGKLPKSAG
jgi:hypothetical protein